MSEKIKSFGYLSDIFKHMSCLNRYIMSGNFARRSLQTLSIRLNYEHFFA